MLRRSGSRNAAREHAFGGGRHRRLRGLFAPVDRKNRVFRRLGTAAKVLPEFPLTARQGARGPVVAEKPLPPARPAGLAHSVGRRADQVAERYAPAYVIIDRQYEVLHFSGRTGRFLALHELTTNAVKHGALTNSGKIHVAWRLNGDGTSLHFDWTEKNGHPIATAPSREGFGMELLTRILPYDLDAKTSVSFEPQGLRFSMELPLDHVVQK